MAKQATVPLAVAEFLRVTLQIAKQSESLTPDQKQRIGMVLAMYEVRRDEWLLNQGYTQNQINGLAKSAALALANYFEDAANETLEEGSVLTLEAPKDDFNMDDFERQFGGNHDSDSD